MTGAGADQPILTLEPLLEAVQEGLEALGWELSGIQKTTSFEFTGRWAGESSRSAYLFFHREDVAPECSIDVFLDETSSGLRGNIALVLDGPPLARADDPKRVLEDLSRMARRWLPQEVGVPLTLRYRMPARSGRPEAAETEYRIKVRLPNWAFQEGTAAVAAFSSTIAAAFERLLEGESANPLLF